MVKVLIPTKPDDADAIYVKLALEKKGHEAIVWYTADIPELQKHSFELNNETLVWNAEGKNFKVNSGKESFDAVWLRRPRKPKLPDFIHQDDVDNAKNENISFFKTLWYMIAPRAFWVNSFDTSNSANCKLLQLKIAKEVGLNVPHTLVSNDPEKIREFINLHKKSGAIYKTLFPVIWTNKNEMRLTYTDVIRVEDLPSDSMLQYKWHEKYFLHRVF